jgi:hypothetical protein
MGTGKRTLIVAKTFAEAQAHAGHYGIHDWRFVSNVGDLVDIRPETHALEFVGRWYERNDLKQLRECICGRGFDPPHLSKIPRNRARLLSHDMPRWGVNDDAEDEPAGSDRNKEIKH